MTATLNRPMTTTIEHTEAAPAEPGHQTFTVGTLTIEAADEAEALRKYKRMVRAEALKAKEDMNWCDSGTNERLRILGLREVGSGVPMRVTVVATRTAYIAVDAEDEDEAKALVAEGGDDILALATASIGRGWTVTSIAAPDGPLIDTTKRRSVDDPDDTVAALHHQGEYPPGLRTCDRAHDGYYCTLPAGHEGPQHAAGNGRRIVHVWTRRNTGA